MNIFILIQQNKGGVIRKIFMYLLTITIIAGNTIVYIPNFTAVAEAAFNEQINYQGKLSDTSGNAVSNGSYNIRYKLYTAPTGGSPLWTETACYSADSGATCTGTGVDSRAAVSNGLFSNLLGNITSFSGVDFDQTLYLGVEIGGNGTTPTWDGEMTPRKKLGAVPAAFVADNAHLLNGLSSGQFLRSDILNASALINTATINYASTTALSISGDNGLTIGSLNGPLQAINGQVSASSTLSSAYGGTGQSSYTTGSLLYGNSTGGLSPLAAGSNGLVLKLIGGVPTWQSDLTSSGGGGASAWATSTDNLSIYPADTSNVVIIGSNATTSLGNIFEVVGNSKLGGLATISNLLTTGSSTLQRFTFTNATGTQATTTSFFSTTASSSRLYSTNANIGTLLAGGLTANNLVVGSLNGVLFGTNGAVGTVSTSSLNINSDNIVEGTSNLFYTNPRVQTYLDTISKGYFFSTTSAAYWDSTQSRWATTSTDYWLTTKSTTDLAEGSKLFYTDERVNSYIDASSTIPKTYSSNTFTNSNAFNGGLTANTLSVGTLNGPLQAINGVVSASSTLSVPYGGTGLQTVPTLGQLLVGNANGGYTLTSTTSLNIAANLSNVSGTLGIINGGTGATSFGQGWIYSDGTNPLSASTSPTVNYITATSTTATSTFAGGLNVLGTINTVNPYYQNGINILNTNAAGDFLSIGVGALAFRASSGGATAIGLNAGRANSTASGMTAIGYEAAKNINGNLNTAVGYNAMKQNSSGTANTVLGAAAMQNVNIGSSNTVIGTNSGLGSGSVTANYSSNTLVGAFIGQSLDTGGSNVILGSSAASSLNTGGSNVIIGTSAGTSLTSGSSNIIIGTSIDAPSATLSNQLTLGNILFGTGLTSTGTTVSTGKLGVGTTTPFAKLSVQTIFGDSNTNAFAVGSSTNSTTGTKTLFVVGNNGNVGIGTSTSGFALGVSGQGSFDDFVRASNFIATSSVASIFPYASTTALTVSGTNGLSVGTLNGPLQAINGAVSATSTISTAFGGTGISTSPTLGQLLVGNASGGYTLTSTSSLNIATNLSLVSGTLGVANGGTGATSFGQGWVFSNGGTGALSASTSPTVNFIVATSTTATSTFAGNVDVAGIINSSSPYFQNGFTVLNIPTTGVSGALVAVGTGALGLNTTGGGNTALGTNAAAANLSGFGVTAIGYHALSAENANFNTALGYLAGQNIGGSSGTNVIVGANAMSTAQGGSSNTLVGSSAGNGAAGSSFSSNTIVGSFAGGALDTGGDSNVIIGASAGSAVNTGASNILIGASAGTNLTSGSNNIVIGKSISIPGASSNNQLVLANILYGLGLSSTGTTVSTGRLGIGTTTPLGKLAIQTIFGDSNPNAFAVASSTNSTTGTKTLFVVRNNGNVGIGSSTPGFGLSVAGNGSFDDSVRASYFTATSTSVASIFPYASTTALSIDTFNGPLQANNGLVSATTSIGTSYGGTGLAAAPSYGQLLLGNAAGGYDLVATSSLGLNPVGGGISFIGAQYSPLQSGGTQTFATSSDANILLTITSSGNTHTFTPSWTGTLAASRGGTGVSNPVAGGILLGSYAGGGWQQVATSSLGLLTTDIIEGSKLFYTDARVNSYINASSTIAKTYANNLFTGDQTFGGAGIFNGSATFNGSLTLGSSNGVLLATNGAVSTVSTSSLNINSDNIVQGITNLFYSNSAVNSFINASSTIPKTYASNTFTNSNTFNGTSVFGNLATFNSGVTIGSLTGPLQAINGVVSASSTLSVAYGGTGTSTAPTSGQVLLGNARGGYDLVSTSSLNIATNLSGASGTLGVANGGTGASTFGQGWVFSNGGTGALSASTSPTVNYITATSTTATSTFAGGIQTSTLNLTGGCYAVNGVCLTSGSGTVNAGLQGQLAFYNTSGNAVSGTSTLFITNNANVGIGTTTSNWALQVAGTRPFFTLSDMSAGTNLKHWFTSSQGGNFYIGTSSDTFATSSLSALTINSNGWIGIGSSTPYANLGVAGLVAAANFNADNAKATSTFAGGLNVGGNGLVYDFSSGLTTAAALQTGSFNFDTNAGVVSWIDMPVDANAPIGVPESYTAAINGNPLITVYSQSDGAGGIRGSGVAIGSSTPPYAKLSVFGAGVGTAKSLEVVNGASTTVFAVLDNGNVGIGSTTPRWTLAVAGQGSFDDFVRASYFTATSSKSSTFNYASTTGLTVAGTNGLSVGTLNGPLQANNGVVSATTSISVLYGGTGLTAAPSLGQLLVGNASGGYTLSATSSLNVAISDTVGTLSVARGGTNATSQITNGVNYYNGSSITSGTGLTFNGSNLGIGTSTPWAPLSIGISTYGGTPMFAIGSSSPTGTTTPFMVNTAGNVLIGTSSPLATNNSLVVMGNQELYPGKPQLVGSTTSGVLQGAGWVRVVGRYAFVTSDSSAQGFASSSDDIAAYDVQDPANPKFLSSLATLQTVSAEQFDIAGNYAYVTSYDPNGKLAVIDITNPSSMKQVGYVASTTALGNASSIYISGRYAYVAGFGPALGPKGNLAVVDIADPRNPVIVSSIQNSDLWGAVYVIVKGKYAYVTNRRTSNGKLLIFDISDPKNPVEVGKSATGTAILGLYVGTKYAYAAAGDTLNVYDISNPYSQALPVVGSVRVPNAGLFTIKVAGKYLYLTNYPSDTTGGLLTFDISSSTNPLLISTSQNLAATDDLFIDGDYAYITGNGSASLYIMRISGIDSSGANIGNLYSDDINVANKLTVGQDLYVTNGITTGLEGIMSQGPGTFGGHLFVQASSTSTISPLSINTTSSSGATSSLMYLDNTGNLGLGTTSPYAKLSVVGQIVGAYFTATTSTASIFPYASTTALTVSGTNGLSVGSLNGPLQAINGVVSASSTLSTAYGGTGKSTYATGDLLYGNSTGGLSTLAAGSDGLVLKLAGGVPTWATDATGGSGAGSDVNWTFFNNSGIRVSTTTNQVLIGASSTSTNQILEVIGGGYFSGNVGIGTTTPGTLLSVGNTQGINFTTGTSTFSTTGGINLTSGCFSINGTCVSGGTGGGGGSGTVNSGTQGQVSFYNANGTAVSGTSTITIATNSNVGIGTTSPYAKLSVAGLGVFDNIFATSTTATSTFAGGLDVGNGSLKFDVGAGMTSISNLQVGNMNFDTDAGAVSWADMVVDSSAAAGVAQSYTANINGNPLLTIYAQSDGAGGIRSSGVAIGSTTPPSAKLSIFGGGTTTGKTFEVVNSASTTNFVVLDNGNTGVGTTSPFKAFSVNGNVAFNGLNTSTSGNALCILAGGEVVSAGANTCVSSSARFKHNIIDLDLGGIDTVMALQPRAFDRNVPSPSQPSGKEMGFIAEEVNKVEPRLVEFEPDGVTPRGVNYEEYTAVLTKAIQEQQGKIGSLASSTNSLQIGVSGLSTTTINTASSVDTLNLNFASLSTNLASSSQTVSSLSRALDTANLSIAGMSGRIDDLFATTSQLAINLRSEIGIQISGLIASSTFTSSLASSTADILASSTPSFIGRIADAVKELIASTGDWVVQKVSGALASFTRVETQTAAVSQGLEMTDQATGQIYCVSIKNGDWDKRAGACSAPAPAPQVIPVNPADAPVTANNAVPAQAPAPAATSTVVSTPVVPASTSTPIVTAPVTAPDSSATPPVPVTTPDPAPAPDVAPVVTPPAAPVATPDPVPAPASAPVSAPVATDAPPTSNP